MPLQLADMGRQICNDQTQMLCENLMSNVLEKSCFAMISHTKLLLCSQTTAHYSSVYMLTYRRLDHPRSAAY